MRTENTIEMLQNQLNKLKRAEHILKNNEFLNEQLKLNNIKLFIMSFADDIYVQSNVIMNGVEAINTGTMSYSSWKEKLRRELNKEGFFHDKSTFMKYKLKENDI